MLTYVFAHLDTALGWLERTPWGTKVIAVVFSAAMSIWAFATTAYPPVAIVFGALVALWLGIDVQEYLLPRIRTWLGPPLQIEISGFSTDKSTQVVLLPVGGGGPCFKLTFPIHLLNRSPKRRVSLKFDGLTFEPPQGAGLMLSGGITAVGVTMNLGPEEDTSGTMMADGILSEFRPGATKIKITLLVSYRLSGRRARLSVPGHFPSKRQRKARR